MGRRHDDGPLYSRKLHNRGRRLSASCETSWTIFALFLVERVTNHFARRSLPVAKFFLKKKGFAFVRTRSKTHLASIQGENNLLPFPSLYRAAHGTRRRSSSGKMLMETNRLYILNLVYDRFTGGVVRRKAEEWWCKNYHVAIMAIKLELDITTTNGISYESSVTSEVHMSVFTPGPETDPKRNILYRETSECINV